MNIHHPPATDKFRAYRARKKAVGLREIRMWVPDVLSTAFREKLAKNMAATSAQEDEQDAMIFVEMHSAELWDELD